MLPGQEAMPTAATATATAAHAYCTTFSGRMRWVGAGNIFFL